MFPLKFLLTVGKSRRLRCWNEIPVVDDCIITYGVLHFALKELQGFLKMQPSGDPGRLLEEHPGLKLCYFFLSRNP